MYIYSSPGSFSLIKQTFNRLLHYHLPTSTLYLLRSGLLPHVALSTISTVHVFSSSVL